MSPILSVILVSTALGVVRVWSYRRRGRSIISALGLSFGRNEVANASVGVAIGIAGIAATFAVAYVTKTIAVAGVGPAAPLLDDLASFVMVPFLEELIFRGALLGGLLILLPNRAWLAVIASAAVFGGLHMLNENATLLSGLGSTVGGITYGIALVATETLWLPFGLHFAWNYAQGPVFGFAVSGGKPVRGSFVQQESIGSAWFTGGEYGPEGGAVGFVGRTLVLALVLAWIAYRTGRARLSPGQRGLESC
jgi:membrane protease YdiL (CAAX protease family)